MRIQILNPEIDFTNIKKIWTILSSETDTSYFLSWGWIEHWITAVSRNAKINLVVALDNSKPVAAFFMGENSITRHKVFPSHGIYFNTTGVSPYDNLCIEYNSLLCSKSFKSTFWDIIQLLPYKWDELFLPGLDSNLIPGQIFSSDNIPSNYRILIEKEVSSPYVNLDLVRRSAMGFIPLLGKNTRSHVRRSYKIYEKDGPVKLECAKTIDTAIEFYEELVDLHQNYWTDKNCSGAFATDFFYSFHMNLIRKRFAHGEIQLLKISNNKETIGYLYNFVFNRKVYFYQSGLNYTENKKVKPGLICHVEAISYNANLSNSVYDFLGGDDQYKRNLSNNANELIWVRVQKPRLKFLIENKLKSTKRSLLQN